MNEIELTNLISEFGKKLSPATFHQYIPKLQQYLIPYILANKSDISDVHKLFKDEFTPQDIINASIYYVINNENVESVSAVNDFLIALNKFFDEMIFNQYPNITLIKYRPFARSLGDEVRTKLKNKGITLRDKEVDPEINDEQFEFIIQYLNNNYKEDNFIFLEVDIIIKLYLLYGFSHDRIANFTIGDYNREHRTLRVKYNLLTGRNIYLELPYSLALCFKQLYEIRFKKYGNKFDLANLFVNRNNKQISHGFIKGQLDKIRHAYAENHDDDERNCFTQTGLQKYAIMKMILGGMNESVILDITNQGPEIYDYCQELVNIDQKVNKNRYINHKIRGIMTFDQI